MPYILNVVKLYNAFRTFIKITRNIYICSKLLHKAQERVSQREVVFLSLLSTGLKAFILAVERNKRISLTKEVIFPLFRRLSR